MADEMLFGDAHVERYRATNGAEGHEWQGTRCLLLTTTGRHSGVSRTAPLIYGRHGDDLLVVASKGGSDQAPAWYLNLEADPKVELQVGADVFPAIARTATPQEKAELWPIMVAEWPDYDVYATKTTRDIPVVVLERAAG
jgi:deazaflavin-dependent oxidoreductase (nitroreductase family)